MKLPHPFRQATIEDCPKIAELFSIASDGVSNYIWTRLQPEYPGLTPLEIGAKRYTNEDSPFSYKNCVVAEHEGEVIGLLVTFPIESADESAPVEVEAEVETSPDAEPTDEPDVLAPYALEAPNTWYICALALFPEFRGQGLGTQFVAIARDQARERGFQELSLLCFEQNTGAFRLYERHGFKVIDRTAVVPHALIHYTGDVLLMTAPV